MSSGLYTKRDFQIAKEVAWHKLTRIKEPEMTDFPEITPMSLFYNGNKDMVFGNRKFVVPVAMDDLLPVAPPYCGETLIDTDDHTCAPQAKDKRGTYILFTPREAWEWVKEVLSGTNYTTKSIGMLWNRSFWFISVELTELKSLEIGDGRKTCFQLNFSGGLDRSVSPQCELSSIVAVCHNTISLSRASGKILFHERATKHFSDRLEAAKSEVATAVGMTAVFEASMKALAKQACDVKRAERIFAGYVTPAVDSAKKPIIKMATRSQNTVKALTNLHVNGIANKGKTEFDLLNSYTEFYTRGAVDAKTSLGRRFASSEFGNNADSKADFLNLLINKTVKLDDGEFWTLNQIEERGDKLLAVA
jgi:Domain of unknown function (DUF932)